MVYINLFVTLAINVYDLRLEVTLVVTGMWKEDTTGVETDSQFHTWSRTCQKLLMSITGASVKRELQFEVWYTPPSVSLLSLMWCPDRWVTDVSCCHLRKYSKLLLFSITVELQLKREVFLNWPQGTELSVWISRSLKIWIDHLFSRREFRQNRQETFVLVFDYMNSWDTRVHLLSLCKCI